MMTASLKAELAWLKEQFNAVMNLALACGEVIDGSTNGTFDSYDYKYIFDEYSVARKNFEMLKGSTDLSLKEFSFIMPQNFKTYEVRRILYTMAIECKKAIAYIEEIKYPVISNKSKGELKVLREEMEKISSKIEPYIEKNIILAIDAFEDGHVLGASLITSRIIEYYLDKLPGDDIDKQILSLRSKIKSEKKREDIRDFEQNLIKGSKFARNLFSHNITAIPEPEESLSLLGDCVRLIKIMS